MDALSFSTVFSSFAVNDLDKAYDFYTNVLGLELTKEDMGVLSLHVSGNKDHTIIYPKPNHEPAIFTVLNLGVADVDATVRALSARGIVFEQYHTGDIETDEQGISRSEGHTVAWFKDPAGNILSVMSAQQDSSG